jgi:SWI/SNF-related matrix-associated actin-dependent regulator of chromatin subfamily A3
LEGTIAGEKGFYDCPILLKIFGPGEPNARAALEARLKSDKVPLKKRGAAAPKKPVQNLPPPRKQTGYSGSSQPSSSQASSQPELIPELSIQDFVQNSERFNPREAAKIVEAWGAGEDALAKMPMADQPEGLKSTLLPYQRQGLAWMMEKENPVLPAVSRSHTLQLLKLCNTENSGLKM